MYSPRKKLSTPKDFHFPFEPYDIQQQLMEAVYKVIEHKEIGIFESPTGTGKSLTLTCAALRWLEDHEMLMRQELQERISEKVSVSDQVTEIASIKDDWINEQYQAKKDQEELQHLHHLQSLFHQNEEKLRQIRERRRNYNKERLKPRLKKPSEYSEKTSDNDADWKEIEKASDDSDEDQSCAVDMQQFRQVKIFFCSRTHSQLAQVVREVKRTDYGNRIRCISLASRQQLCVHPQVRKLNGTSLNERCLEMARAERKVHLDSGVAKRPRISKCQYKTPTAVQQLSDVALVDVLDIEELVSEGEFIKACPFYAARTSIESSQMIMLPYQLLLHRKSRLQSGIDLRDSVVIIDEAHNLLDAIVQMHSSEISLKQLMEVQQQTQAYKMHYTKRFSCLSLLRINQLVYVIKRLIKLMQPKIDIKNQAPNSRVFRTYELSAEGEFFNIDLFELLAFCERTHFAQKLKGFVHQQNNSRMSAEDNETTKETSVDLLRRLQSEHLEKPPSNVKLSIETESINLIKLNEELRNTSSPIQPLLAFIEALTENAEDGRVLLHIDGKGESSRTIFKYVLLNPGRHFEDVVRQARAIIVAGGTMQPTAELTEQIFQDYSKRVQVHLYDHVVPQDAVLPLVISRGPTGERICFTYSQRNTEKMLSELASIIRNICNVVPSGVICFCPSYDYLDTVYAYLERKGVLREISLNKSIFCEPRSTGGATIEKFLVDYAEAIGSKKGALLFSVVGGKLSEGLNFADELGRGVIVVGMPYPNRQSPELQERFKYLDATLQAGAGNENYENLCMKAVNQCIGRSVRHIRDYACVFLLDERYTSARIKKKLPHWISRSLITLETFGEVQTAVLKFFEKQKK